ncbi:MAG: helix-turn-helix transcriptional regulator [archaeon]|nr:MAG: helix-turn-helix transcriptional regulator [archaeon]
MDEEILKLLRESPEPLSTYEIAKKLNISWSTANVHLKDLQLKNMVKNREEMIKSKRRLVWWVEQRTIGKFFK